MSSTPSKIGRASEANGAAWRTRANRSSTSQSSMATIATICCASTSSGLRGMWVASTRPSRIARTAAAQASRSPRYFGKIRPALVGVHAVAGATDALQAAGHRRRRFDLHHEIDRAHVDAELERGGAGEPAQAAGLERVLDLDALLARQRAVMGAHQRLAGQFVDRRGQPFGEAAAVHEEQRRACARGSPRAAADGSRPRSTAPAGRRRPVRW